MTKRMILVQAANSILVGYQSPREVVSCDDMLELNEMLRNGPRTMIMSQNVLKATDLRLARTSRC